MTNEPQGPEAFTRANVETAMVLWQELLAETDAGMPQALHLMYTEGPTRALQTVISWVKECEAQWEADRKEGVERVPYHGGHCAEFLHRKLRGITPILSYTKA